MMRSRGLKSSSRHAKRRTIRTIGFVTGVAALALAAVGGSAGPGRAQEVAPGLGAGFASAGAGSKIAFTADREGRDAPDENYVVNGDGTGERRVTVKESGNSVAPEGSPHGQTNAVHHPRA